ncbi:putative proteasome subunit alpha type-7 [Astathelohania contejeani]|uniref:Proteasome subunit alpha type-7 n=1 Tax=Astathelohania contejeani TaxID=164912 RepID=A0ABQ7HXM8_9MICR|nr:putative proteasome subunit alpha type-7 [Thelohania contejeani]
MSNQLDFGPIYTPTGNILQIDYAQKCADHGNTCIGIRTNTGIVLVAEKPITTKLYKLSTDEAIRRVTSICNMTYSGLMTDGEHIYQCIKHDVFNYMENMEEHVSPGMLKKLLSGVMSIFTRYFGCRPIGCNFIFGLLYDKNYNLLCCDPSGDVGFYKAHAIGKGATRAKTELEKLEIDNLSVEDAIDHAIRILYKSYDPLKDKEFEIEVSILSENTNYVFKKVDAAIINNIADKYKDLSIDDN